MAVAIACLAAGLVVGLVMGALVIRRRATTRAVAELPPVPGEVVPELAVPAEVLRHLPDRMRLAVVVLDNSSDVALANPAIRDMGVVRGGHLIVEDLHRLAREARVTGEAKDVTVDLPDPRLRREPVAVRAYVVPLGDAGYVALFLEDITESRRLAAVRRDFVANISHELKTPVGALSLLGEAIEEAADDPEAVRRFAGRVHQEGGRLGRLVQELIELSRLEGADPLPSSATIVSVDHVVGEALDQTRLAAESASISVVTGGESGLEVRGDETQLITAVANLVGNAIAYSPSGTRVAVGTRLRSVTESADPALEPADPRENRRGEFVEISVADQGIGIAESDLDRIFERFYRADPARSRATGGTGLGLAIVKHIVSNHGGEVRVWSVEGSGSTFTLRLPAARAKTSPDVPTSMTAARHASAAKTRGSV